MFRDAVADLGGRPGCGAAACRPPARGGATRRSPRPTAGCVDEAEAAGGRPRGADRGGPRRLLPRASSPRRIAAFCADARRSWTPPARPHRGLLDADDLARWEPTVERAACRSTTPASTVHKTGPWGQGPVLLQQLRLLAGLRPRRRWATCRSTGSTPSSSAPSSRSPTGRPGTPTRPRRRPARRRCCRRRTPPSGGRWSATTASYELRPGSPDGRTPRAARRRASPGGARPAVTSDGAGEPTVLGDGEHPRRHLPRRRRRPGRPHGLGDARAAAGCRARRRSPALGFCLGSRAQMMWLEPGLPTTLRRRGAPAHDAVAVAGHPRRRAVAGVRHARRRPAGPVVAGVPARRTCTAGWTCRAPIDAPMFSTRRTSRARSTRGRPPPAGWSSRAGCRAEVVAGLRDARPRRARSAATGRRAGCRPPARDPATGLRSRPPPTRAGMQGYAVGR